MIGLAENGQILYIVAEDHLNAPQIVMDSTGRSIWSAKYNEFGKATIISNYKLNLRADGQYQDDETGLYYNWHRYYNPDLGRYITSDPIGLQAGMNTYIYVNGNPVNATDPMGLETWQCQKPLHALSKFGMLVAYAAYNTTAMYHQYTCIFPSSDMTLAQCGGQDIGGSLPSGWKNASNFLIHEGKPSVDTFPADGGKCTKIADDNKCYEECIKQSWSENRPAYNVIPEYLMRGHSNLGIKNCQDYDKDINARCKSQCSTINYFNSNMRSALK